MELSEKSILEYQSLVKKEYGKDITYAEAAEAARNLIGLFELLYEMNNKQMRDKEKLKEFPKGYSFMDGKTYNCGICRDMIKDDQLWYDKWGQKCRTCQKAIDKKIIPGKICRDDDSWYKVWEFEYYFKMKPQTVRKLAKQGILKVRVIPSSEFLVFLIKDNALALPPKKDVKSRSIMVGENTYSSQSWFDYKNPQEVLEKYTIWPYLTVFHQSPEKP